ncbi:unnamed protein product [Pseudo-nitzschia multistriata]|uniref:Myb-like domain-containing protein n=1 Tax=Pseudo-nitzschia multistriata TaxID=183589 RepID=A0A448ZCI5_9STRA|nr:unnamed protein product [Pseudo-nitzschia multistriata]
MGNAGSGMGVPGSGFPPQQHHHHPHQISQFLPPMDRCAGCGAVDTPLLACDDLDRASGKKKDIVIDPSQRLRFCANCMIGKKVRVFWPVDNSWYIGTVQQFNAVTGEHLLKYEDDDTEWVHIGESNTTMNPSDFTPQQPLSAQVGIVAPQPNNFVPRSEAGSSPADKKSAMVPASRIKDGNTTPTIANADPKNRVGSSSASGGPTTTKGTDTQSAAGPGLETENPSNALHTTYRTFGSAQIQGNSYPPNSSSGQRHLPPHLAHHQPHHIPQGYGHGPGGPPQPTPYGSFSSSSLGHGPQPLGYGYPGHPGMGIPQRHGAVGALPPHHYGGMQGHPPHPHRIENPAQISNAPGSGGNVGANGKKKTGPKAWTKEEDALLLSIVQSMRVPMKWSLVAQSLPERTGKQCRERYVNHLNPRLKVADWSPTEDATIFHLYNTIGSHWAKMSKIIPGRTDNGIKNRFHNLRRQLEREDEHRLRLNASRDFPEEIRLELIREFPEELRGKAAELWDIKSGLSVLAAQSVLGGDRTRTAGRFGPFREAVPGEDICVRCGFCLPSVQTGSQICTKTGWCQSCARIPPHVSGNMLRECLNLRRCQNAEKRKIIESWEIPDAIKNSKKNKQ